LKRDLSSRSVLLADPKKQFPTEWVLLAEPKKKQFLTEWILSVEPKKQFPTEWVLLAEPKKTISYRMDFVGGTKKRFPHKRVCWRNQKKNNFLPNGFCRCNQKTVSTQTSLLVEPKKKTISYRMDFIGGTKKTVSTQRSLLADVPVCYLYDVPQQEWPESVLLVPVWTLSLNENLSHPFNGVYNVFLPPLPECIPIEKKRFYLTAVRTKTNTADTGGL